MNKEAKARQKIDTLLVSAGWAIQNRDQLNLSAARGVAVREYPLKTGFADYLLFVDRRVIGAIKAAWKFNPDYPDAFDGILWSVERRWCHPTVPDCQERQMTNV
jgi:hypothetical protein